jgi:type IV pilus assembly protein PilC
MLTYHYTARNPSTGQKVQADVEADNELAAAKLIRKEGLVPIDIKSADAGLGGLTKKLNHVKAKDRVLFSRQLATLINAGLPIIQSLRSVGDQTQNKPLKLIISKVVTDVESGSTLAKSLRKYPKVFSAVYVSLVEAGETSGTLDKSLERLAVQQEKDADIVSKIRGAMTYPIIVVLVMGAVLAFMLVKVLPQVQTLYAGLPGAQLPFITTILLSLSHFVTKFWWVVILLIVVGVIALLRWSKTSSGKKVFDRFKMRAGPIGKLYMKVYMARFSRTASTLVASGVPIIQVLDITGEAVDNVYIKESLRKATEKIKAGKALSVTLQDDPNFLSLVPQMLSIGEESGSMEQMLERAAEYYEKEVDNEVASISSIIEPILMIVLGVVALIIVAAVLLPIYGLANQGLGSGSGGV